LKGIHISKEQQIFIADIKKAKVFFAFFPEGLGKDQTNPKRLLSVP